MHDFGAMVLWSLAAGGFVQQHSLGSCGPEPAWRAIGTQLMLKRDLLVIGSSPSNADFLSNRLCGNTFISGVLLAVTHSHHPCYSLHNTGSNIELLLFDFFLLIL